MAALLPGQFALFTYVRPFLETVTRVNASGLSLILLAIGVAGFAGTLIITPFLNARFYQTLMNIPLIMATIAGALLLAGQHPWAVAGLLSLWGMLATATPQADGHGRHGRCPKMLRREKALWSRLSSSRLR